VPSPPLSPDTERTEDGTGAEAAQFLGHIFCGQDRFERLLEKERSQRQADVDTLRRTVEAHEARIHELVHEQCQAAPTQPLSARNGLEQVCQDWTADVHELLERLRQEFSASEAERTTRSLGIVNEQERQQAKLSSLESSVTDLQRQFVSFQETQTWQTSHSETLFEYMHRDLESLREKVHQQGRTDEEVRTFIQSTRQANSDVSCRITEVTSSMESADRSMRRELQVVKSELEADMARQRAELSELTLCLADERKKREVEVTETRGQMLEVQAAFSSAVNTAATLPQEDVASLRASLEAVEAVRRELVRLEAAAAEAAAARIEDAASARRHAEALCMSEALLEDRKAREADLTELRNRTEDVHTLHSDLGVLKTTLQAFVEECRECATAVVRSEVEAEELEAESRKAAGLVFASRMEALEAWCREHAAAVSREQVQAAGRIHALEAELRQVRARQLPDAGAVAPAPASEPISTARSADTVPGECGGKGDLTPTVTELKLHAQTARAAGDITCWSPAATPSVGGGIVRSPWTVRTFSSPLKAPPEQLSVEHSPCTGQATPKSPVVARQVMRGPQAIGRQPTSPRPRGAERPLRCASNPVSGHTSPSRSGGRVGAPDASEAIFVLHTVLPPQAHCSNPSVPAGTPAAPPPGVATPGGPGSSLPPTPVPAWRGATSVSQPPGAAAHLVTVRSSPPTTTLAPPPSTGMYWAKPATAR